MQAFKSLFLVAVVGSATHVKDLCHKGLCGAQVAQPLAFPQTVAIPQLSTIASAKPIFHQHGLIKVQLPPQQVPILAPAAVATTQQFAVGTPRLGKVVDKTEPTYFCKKPGFALEGNVCVSTAVQAPTLICPGGFDSLDGRCLRRAQVLESCPPGYSRRQGHCAKLVSAAFLATCPPDTIETAPGVCTRRLAHPLTPTCPEGTYDPRTGSCVVTAFTEAQAFCPEGFQFTDGACLQTEVYDCSHNAVGLTSTPALGTISTVPIPPTVGLQQPIGHGHIGGHGHVKGRILHHMHGQVAPLGLQQVALPIAQPQIPAAPLALAPPVIAQAPCAPTPCVAQAPCPQTPCPPEPCAQTIPVVAARVAPVPCEPQPQVVVQATKTSISVQKTCTRVTSTALVFACETGVLQGNRCLVKQTVPAVPVCNAQGDIGECFTTVSVAPLQECPPEFSRECLPGRPCECVALEAAAIVTSCPVGFDTFGEGCVRSAELRATCPPGFLLQDDQCVRVLREAADCIFSVTYECDSTTGTNCQNFIA